MCVRVRELNLLTNSLFTPKFTSNKFARHKNHINTIYFGSFLLFRFQATHQELNSYSLYQRHLVIFFLDIIWTISSPFLLRIITKDEQIAVKTVDAPATETEVEAETETEPEPVPTDKTRADRSQTVRRSDISLMIEVRCKKNSKLTIVFCFLVGIHVLSFILFSSLSGPYK